MLFIKRLASVLFVSGLLLIPLSHAKKSAYEGHSDYQLLITPHPDKDFEANVDLTNPSYPNYVTYLAQKGWAELVYKGEKDLNSLATLVLKPFDLLDRNSNGEAQRTKALPLVIKTDLGQTPVRTGMNNYDSSQSTAVDQDVVNIFAAENNIYIKDQFLFDRNVVLALLKAKDIHPDLKIRAILESFIPNNLYLNILKDAGIEVKKQITHKNAIIDQEFHGKTMSIDGKLVIAGSANKDQSTMFGSFREEQLEVYDEEVTKVHDLAFSDENWASNLVAVPFELDPNEFKFLAESKIKDLTGNPLTPEGFLGSLRNIVSILYDARAY